MLFYFIFRVEPVYFLTAKGIITEAADLLEPIPLTFIWLGIPNICFEVELPQLTGSISSSGSSGMEYS